MGHARVASEAGAPGVGTGPAAAGMGRAVTIGVGAAVLAAALVGTGPAAAGMGRAEMSGVGKAVPAVVTVLVGGVTVRSAESVEGARARAGTSGEAALAVPTTGTASAVVRGWRHPPHASPSRGSRRG